MGLVYRAQQAPLDRTVALKLMLAATDPQREDEFQRRFFLEAATAAKLRHPNTITVFDYGTDTVDGQKVLFIAMEHLDGITLTRAIKKRALSPLRAVHIALQVCRSLREAHRAKVVHRDLKPSNIMLVRPDDDDDEGQADFVKVLDFGLAKTFHQTGASSALTRAGTFLGSPRYVSPEQIEGRPVDPRADIYSFGCVLYRMLAARVPFDGKNHVEIMMKHLSEPPPPLGVPEVPQALEQLVMHCLEKDARDRPQSLDRVIAQLKLIKGQLGGESSGLISRQAVP